MKNKFKKLFGRNKVIIGMIHIKALAGTPGYKANDQKIMEQALAEAAIYQAAGIDALAIENMHDVPYLKRKVGPEITTMMSLIGYEIKRQTQMPCGIQILAGANQQALAAAKTAGMDFIRAEGFVYGHLADEGYMESDAGSLLRYRKQIDAEHISIFTDIKKKHSAHSLTMDVDLLETAQTAKYFRSDGVIITGSSTGKKASIVELELLQELALPILVGSGVNIDNVAEYLPLSDALIVGSWFKKDGHWSNELEGDRVKRFMEKVDVLREVNSQA